MSSPAPVARIAPVLTRPAAPSDVESSDNDITATKVNKGGKKAAEPVEEVDDDDDDDDDDEEVGEDEYATALRTPRRMR